MDQVVFGQIKTQSVCVQVMLYTSQSGGMTASGYDSHHKVKLVSLSPLFSTSYALIEWFCRPHS